MTRKLLSVLFVVVLFSTRSSTAALWNVTVTDFEFSPSALTISLGDTVVWTNVLGFHNVVEACGTPLFGNATGDAPWMYQFVFSAANGAAVGTYPYFCEVHPDIMWGVVTVVRPPQRFNVTVASFSFTPATVTVQTGDTIVWTRANGTHNVHHNVASPKFHNTISGSWTTYVWPCSVGVGAYPYLCQQHPASMTGTVNVTAAPLPPAAPAALVAKSNGTDVELTWESVSAATCYVVFRKTPDYAATPFTEVVGATGDTAFVHFGGAVLPSRSFYEVRAINN